MRLLGENNCFHQPWPRLVCETIFEWIESQRRGSQDLKPVDDIYWAWFGSDLVRCGRTDLLLSKIMTKGWAITNGASLCSILSTCAAPLDRRQFDSIFSECKQQLVGSNKTIKTAFEYLLGTNPSILVTLMQDEDKDDRDHYFSRLVRSVDYTWDDHEGFWTLAPLLHAAASGHGPLSSSGLTRTAVDTLTKLRARVEFPYRIAIVQDQYKKLSRRLSDQLGCQDPATLIEEYLFALA
jgi:hypothetical protein